MTLAFHGYPDYQRSLQTADLFVTTGNQFLNPNQSLTTPALDLRPYSSYNFYTFPTVSSGPTGFGHVYIDISWFNDSGLTDLCYREEFEIFPRNSTAGAFFGPTADLAIQDAVHGAYLFISVTNKGSDQISAKMTVTGTSRIKAETYIRHATLNPVTLQFETAGLLLSETGTALAAGAQANRLLRIAPGPVRAILFSNPGASAFSWFTPDGRLFDQVAVAAGVLTPYNTIHPEHAVRLMALDTSGAPNTFSALLTSGRANG